MGKLGTFQKGNVTVKLFLYPARSFTPSRLLINSAAVFVVLVLFFNVVAQDDASLTTDDDIISEIKIEDDLLSDTGNTPQTEVPAVTQDIPINNIQSTTDDMSNNDFHSNILSLDKKARVYGWVNTGSWEDASAATIHSTETVFLYKAPTERQENV